MKQVVIKTHKQTKVHRSNHSSFNVKRSNRNKDWGKTTNKQFTFQNHCLTDFLKQVVKFEKLVYWQDIIE